MDLYKDTSTCPSCNKEFEWCSYKLKPGEGFISKLDNVSKNCLKLEIDNETYYAKIECPYCNKIYSIQNNL